MLPDQVPSVDDSAPTTDFVRAADPVMDAFWVDVPSGWDCVVYASGSLAFARAGEAPRTIVV